MERRKYEVVNLLITLQQNTLVTEGSDLFILLSKL